MHVMCTRYSTTDTPLALAPQVGPRADVSPSFTPRIAVTKLLSRESEHERVTSRREWRTRAAAMNRGVWQLRSLLIQYCNRSGSSRGVKDYAERFLVPFAEANPQLSIAVSMRPGKHPYVRGWYVQDRPKRLSLINLSAEQVIERIQLLRDMRPIGLRKNAKAFRTTPSIQGEWELGQKLDRPHAVVRA